MLEVAERVFAARGYQAATMDEIADRVAAGEAGIAALMVESFIEAGNQSLGAEPLVYGKSVTDACIDWSTTDALLTRLAEAVRAGRAVRN